MSAAVAPPPPPPVIPEIMASTFRASCLPIEPGVVMVDVATFHTSVASVPKSVSVRLLNDQIVLGRSAKSEDDAFPTTVLVFAFTFAATAAVMSAVEGAEEVAMMNVLSSFTKSPVRLDPQVICAGQVPWVVDEKS